MTAIVLLVDDEADNRRIVRDALEHAGYEVCEAVDGRGALELARSKPPDLVVMDIQLPGMDGYETTRALKGDPALSHIPVIAVTSYALMGDDEKAFAAGCDAYVPKPFSPRRLVQIVGEHLSRAEC